MAEYSASKQGMKKGYWKVINNTGMVVRSGIRTKSVATAIANKLTQEHGLYYAYKEPKKTKWDTLSGEEQDIITDHFFKERDVYPYDDNGNLTPVMKRILKNEGYFDKVDEAESDDAGEPTGADPDGKVDLGLGDEQPQFLSKKAQVPLTMTKVPKLGSQGSGWHKEPVSHSYASKFGKAPQKVRGR